METANSSDPGGRSSKTTTTSSGDGRSSSSGLEAIPASLLVHDILLRLDLASLSSAACVSKTLRSSAGHALSSLSSLQLVRHHEPHGQLPPSGLLRTRTLPRPAYSRAELVTLHRDVAECSWLDWLEMPQFEGADVGVGRAWHIRRIHWKLSSTVKLLCTLGVSLSKDSRRRRPGYAFSSGIWPKSIKVLKLQPALEDDMISLVKDIAGNENWPEVIRFPSLPSTCSLQSLSLHVSAISDKLVTTIAESMPCLLELELEDRTGIDVLRHSDLTNAGIQSLGSCKQLKSLSLSRNRQNCQSYFSKYNCRVAFNRVNDLGIFLLSEGCKGLESVRLSGFAEVSDAGFASFFRSCKNLKKFEVHYSRYMSDLAFHDLTEAPCSLTELRIHSCNLITSETVKKLAFCSNLEVLDLLVCRSVADSGLCSLSSLKMLNTLDLPGTAITDSGLLALGQGSAPIQRLSLSYCQGVTDKGIYQLLSSGGIISKTLYSLDLGYLRHVSEETVRAVALFGVAITELCLRSCVDVTDSSVEALARKGSLEDGSQPIRRLDLFFCIGLSVESLQMLKKPLFRGLRWVGVGDTRLAEEGGSVLSEIYEERPWLTVCTGGCEMGCQDGWEHHGASWE